MSMGIKDKPEHINYDDDYISTVQMISERHFVFYDTTCRRAWLLDGASALLHLLRAFIKNCQTQPRLKTIFVLEDDDELQTDERLQGGMLLSTYLLMKTTNCYACGGNQRYGLKR